MKVQETKRRKKQNGRSHSAKEKDGGKVQRDEKSFRRGVKRAIGGKTRGVHTHTHIHTNLAARVSGKKHESNIFVKARVTRIRRKNRNYFERTQATMVIILK